jgi:hypothetical protein
MKVRNDRDLATELHCDIRTVQAYRRRGAPMDDILALKEWIAAQRTGPTKGTATEINEAKLEKLRLEIRRLERDNAVADGNVIQKSTATAHMRTVAAAVQARLNTLPGESPAWAGLKPHEIQARAKEFVRETFAVLHDKTSACYGK